MKKILNFRLLVAVAISIILGIVACNFRPFLKGLGVAILFILALISLGVSFFVFRGVKIKLRVFIVALCFISSIVGYYRFYGYISRFNDSAVQSGDYTVSGTVKDISFTEKGKRVILKNCRYDGTAGANLLFYGAENTEIDLGDDITVKLTVTPSQKEIYGKYSYYALENIGLIGTNPDSISVDGNSGGIFNRVRRKIKSVIVGSDDEISGVALALILGDTSRLTYNEKENFRLGGIAHVFAVSGLHIGLLFLALVAMLKPARLSIWIKNFIIFIAVLFYSGACGFSPSSLRASLTAGAYLTARCFGEKPDGINGLSLASIIISLVNPKDVLGAGFVLSFTVCFFVLTLCPPISRKTKVLGEKFSLAFSVVLTAELSAFPVLITNFGKFPVVSLISNLALIPVVTMTFYVLWIAVILSLVLPILSFSLFLPLVLLKGVYGITTALSAFGSVTVFPKILTVPYYTSLVLSSDLINVEAKKKKIFLSSVAIIIIYCAIFSLFY